MINQLQQIIVDAIDSEILIVGRVPYTYHHDYVRCEVPGNLSRGEVAQLGYTEESLIAGTFLYLIKWDLDWLVRYRNYDLQTLIPFAEGIVQNDINAALEASKVR